QWSFSPPNRVEPFLPTNLPLLRPETSPSVAASPFCRRSPRPSGPAESLEVSLGKPASLHRTWQHQRASLDPDGSHFRLQPSFAPWRTPNVRSIRTPPYRGREIPLGSNIMCATKRSATIALPTKFELPNVGSSSKTFARTLPLLVATSTAR